MKTYKVLYTHQKTKKSKVWQDGILKEVNNTKLSLSGSNGRFVESVFTLSENISLGDEIESDGHLILIDSEDTENSPPAKDIPAPPLKANIRPKFVSKRFTPPSMKSPITPPRDMIECSTSSNQMEQHQLLATYQSRKVVREPLSLVTSLSKTFHSKDALADKINDVTSRDTTNLPFSLNIPVSRDTTNLPLSLNIPASNRSVSDLSKYLEPPKDPPPDSNSPNGDIIYSESYKHIEFPPSVSSFDQSNCRKITPYQQGNVLPNNKQINCSKLNSPPCNNLFDNSQFGTPVPTEFRSIDSIFKALNGECSSSSCTESNNISFDLVDESIFSPTSPAHVISESPIESVSCEKDTLSQDQGESSSVSSSLDKMIDAKIEEVTATNNRISSDRENKSEVSKQPACVFETVDYFDIFGDEDVVEETFGPTVIELATQIEYSLDEENGNALSNKAIVTKKDDDGISHFNNHKPLSDDFSSSIPDDFVGDNLDENPWDIGEVYMDQLNDLTSGKSSKRRKLGDIETKQNWSPQDTITQRRKGFTTPFASGVDKHFRQSNLDRRNPEQLKFAIEPQKRQYCIPLEFKSSAHYKNTLLDVIYEHLNVSLAKVREKYERTKPQSDKQSNSSHCVQCPHGTAKLCTVAKDGPNKGRQFYSCTKKLCDLFQWCETTCIPKSPQDAFNFYSRLGLSFYKDCQLKRKTNSNLYLLQLKVQDKHSNYNKDDFWIINPGSTDPSIMSSTFYGPSSGGYVELRLLTSRHPACGVTVSALQALRAVSELDIIAALDKVHTLPLLPSLLSKQLEVPASVSVPLVDNVEEVCLTMCREYQLNGKQEEAILAFVNSLNNGPAVLCVHGVFGSGKSYLLAVLVLILLKVMDGKQHRILITSTTNVAVDNILIKLLDLGFEHFVRVGSVKRIHKRIASYVVQHQESSNAAIAKQDQVRDIQSRFQVVGTTCASSPGISQHDIVLFDEVSQITEPSSLLPLVHSSCKYLLLVGDPQQLPPTVETQHVKGDGAPGLEQTLFDRLVKLGYPTVLLNTQYRCPPAISAIPNTLFYSGELRDGHVTNDVTSTTLPIPPLTFVSVPGTETSFGDSFSNAAEVKAISDLLEVIISQRKVAKDDVAVITLYRGQESLLKKELTSSKSLKISTVDAVQGAEKPIIILSCVRTTRIGFADCPKRVNVAITRAKQHLIILGNIQMLSTNQLWGTIIQICADRGVVLTLSDVINKIT